MDRTEAIFMFNQIDNAAKIILRKLWIYTHEKNDAILVVYNSISL